MIDIKAVFGILSSGFVAIGFFPYLYDIHKGRVQPHVLSWFGWSILTGIGAFAMLASGSQWAVAILFANMAACFLTALYATLRKVGVWDTSGYDAFLFGLGILGLILWQTLDFPLIALIFALLADIFFSIPTLTKTWNNPKSESVFLWLTASLSGFASLFALRNFSFAESAYPMYLFFYNTVMLLLVLKILKKHTKSKTL